MTAVTAYPTSAPISGKSVLMSEDIWPWLRGRTLKVSMALATLGLEILRRASITVSALRRSDCQWHVVRSDGDSRAGHGQERGLVEDRHAQAAGVVGLAARLVAHDHVARLLRDGSHDASPQTQDQILGLVASHRGERAGEHEALAVERARPVGGAILPRDHLCCGEPVDEPAIGDIGEERRHGVGDLAADSMHLSKLLYGCGGQALQGAEARGEELGHTLAHQADAEGI